MMISYVTYVTRRTFVIKREIASNISQMNQTSTVDKVGHLSVNRRF